MMKLALFAAVCVMLLASGCISTPPAPATPTPTPMPTATPVATPTPTPTPIPVMPLGLVYLLKMPTGGDGSGSQPAGFQEMNITYWLEEQRGCSGRQAFVGIGKFAGEQMQGEGYFKETVYLDNGESAISDLMQRGDLAFDTAKTKARDNLDIAFTLNALFVSAGRNLLTDSVWNSSDPVILRNATILGGSPEDVAVTKKGTDSTARVPCTIFSLTSRGSPTAIEICVTRVGGNGVPYIVYFKPEDPAYNGMMPTWSLTAKLDSASGITRTLQCLGPIHCPAVRMPSGDDRTACEADGNHMMREFRDENGCTVRYDCVEAAGARFTVEMVGPDGRPIPNLEVNLWVGTGEPSGPPQMATNTDAQGRATFNITQGTVWVGFNSNNFPAQYRNPGQSQYRVENEEFQTTVNLQNS